MKFYQTIDAVFKVVMIISIVGGFTIPFVIAGFDYFDEDIPYLSKAFIEKINVLDIPEGTSTSIEINSQAVYTLASAFGLLFLLQAAFTIKRKNAKTRKLTKHFTVFADQYADFASNSFSKLKSIETVVSDHMNENGVALDNSERYRLIIKAAGHYLERVANRICTMADLYTGRKCSVNLKIFTPHSAGVRTFARDESTTDPRRTVDINFENSTRRYEKNTPFKKIIEDPEIHHFISNNLLRDARSGRYINEANPDWKKFYRKCMVIPISRHLPPERESDILGFICIDSKKGNFYEDYFLDVMIIIARLLAVQFDLMARVVALDKLEKKRVLQNNVK